MYGSVINRVIENSSSNSMYVGMGVTECLWSDRHAWEIIAIKDEKHITIRRCKAEMKDGTDWLDQEYNISSDESGAIIQLYKSKHGWRKRIGSRQLGDTKFSVGYASEYRDPSF